MDTTNRNKQQAYYLKLFEGLDLIKNSNWYTQNDSLPFFT